VGIYDDIFKDVKAYLYERLSSPFSGAFIVSWCFWNFNILIILFSAVPAYQTISYIHNEIDLMRGLLLPIITSLLYVFIYPYISKYIYKFWYERQKELKEIKQKIDDETPLTKEESRTIRRQLLEIEERFQQAILSKDTQIEQLKSQLTEADKAKDILSNEISKLTSNLPQVTMGRSPNPKLKSANITEEQIEILKLIAQSSDEMIPFDDILFQVQEHDQFNIRKDKVALKYNLDELTRQHYLKYDYSPRYGSSVYVLQHLGREILVKNQ